MEEERKEKVRTDVADYLPEEATAFGALLPRSNLHRRAATMT